MRHSRMDKITPKFQFLMENFVAPNGLAIIKTKKLSQRKCKRCSVTAYRLF